MSFYVVCENGKGAISQKLTIYTPDEEVSPAVDVGGLGAGLEGGFFPAIIV
jgi:hypothetical protein